MSIETVFELFSTLIERYHQCKNNKSENESIIDRVRALRDPLLRLQYQHLEIPATSLNELTKILKHIKAFLHEYNRESCCNLVNKAVFSGTYAEEFERCNNMIEGAIELVTLSLNISNEERRQQDNEILLSRISQIESSLHSQDDPARKENLQGHLRELEESRERMMEDLKEKDEKILRLESTIKDADSSDVDQLRQQIDDLVESARLAEINYFQKLNSMEKRAKRNVDECPPLTGQLMLGVVASIFLDGPSLFQQLLYKYQGFDALNEQDRNGMTALHISHLVSGIPVLNGDANVSRLSSAGARDDIPTSRSIYLHHLFEYFLSCSLFNIESCTAFYEEFGAIQCFNFYYQMSLGSLFVCALYSPCFVTCPCCFCNEILPAGSTVADMMTLRDCDSGATVNPVRMTGPGQVGLGYGPGRVYPSG